MNEYDELVSAIYQQAVVDLIYGIVNNLGVQSELSFFVSGSYGFDATYGKYVIDKIYNTYDKYTKIINDFRSSDISCIYMDKDDGDVIDMIRVLCHKYHLRCRMKGVKFDHDKPIETKICISKAN